MANIVTAEELGQYLKLSESTIYKLASDGELPGFKIGDSWRFDMDETIKLIRKAKQGKALAKGIGHRVKNNPYKKFTMRFALCSMPLERR